MKIVSKCVLIILRIILYLLFYSDFGSYLPFCFIHFFLLHIRSDMKNKYSL